MQFYRKQLLGLINRSSNTKKTRISTQKENSVISKYKHKNKEARAYLIELHRLICICSLTKIRPFENLLFSLEVICFVGVQNLLWQNCNMKGKILRWYLWHLFIMIKYCKRIKSARVEVGCSHYLATESLGSHLRFWAHLY